MIDTPAPYVTVGANDTAGAPKTAWPLRPMSFGLRGARGAPECDRLERRGQEHGNVAKSAF